MEEFNGTVGAEKGIIVKSVSQGSVNDLEANVLAAVQGEVGADEVPNIFMAYADTAYTIDQMGQVMDLQDYLTEEEKSAYIDSYIQEGDFAGTGEIKIFPTAKSLEVLVLNKTDWDVFPEAVSVSDSESYPIEMDVLPCPKFEGGNYAVQQGAGMLKTLNVGVDMVNGNEMYTTKAFEGGTKARNILEYSLSDKAAADREIVVSRMAQGLSMEESAAEFELDDNFDAWYEETLQRLQEFAQ